MIHSIPLHPISEGGGKSFFDFFEWRKKENEYDASFAHRHQYYELIFFEEGEGVHEIDFVPHKVKSPAIHFLPIGKVHKVAMKLPYSGFSLLFSAAFFPQENPFLSQLSLLQHQNAYPILTLEGEEYMQMKSWILEIKSAWQSQTWDKWEWIRTHLSLILLKSQRLYQNQPSKTISTKNEVIQKFMDLIEIHYLEHLLLKEYADKLCLSESHLNVLCKKECGMSASTLIQERVLQAAKRRLIYTEETVKEIAFDLNFNDVSYFIRFFKKHTGTSPNVYRAETMKNM
jgi:AraC-like DNA-binding protein